MGICTHCGKEAVLPFRCSYCNLTYCSEHRLPENHNCTRLPKRDWTIHQRITNVQISPIPIRKYVKTHSQKSKIYLILFIPISILSIYGANIFLDPPNYIKPFMVENFGYTDNFTPLGIIGFAILTLGHELLHTYAWKYYGHSAKVILVLPMFGLAKGTKPRNYKENFIISMTPILITIVAIIFSFIETNSLDFSQYTTYQFLAILNTMGMGYDFLNALTGP